MSLENNRIAVLLGIGVMVNEDRIQTAALWEAEKPYRIEVGEGLDDD